MPPRSDQTDGREPQRTHEWGEQNADGVDLSLIRRNLRLTPTERLRQNYRYRQQILRMRQLRAIKEVREESDLRDSEST